MRKKAKLKELIFKAQNGDKDALNEVIERFKPIINKYAHRLGVRCFLRNCRMDN